MTGTMEVDHINHKRLVSPVISQPPAGQVAYLLLPHHLSFLSIAGCQRVFDYDTRWQKWGFFGKRVSLNIQPVLE